MNSFNIQYLTMMNKTLPILLGIAIAMPMGLNAAPKEKKPMCRK